MISRIGLTVLTFFPILIQKRVSFALKGENLRRQYFALYQWMKEE